MRIAPLLTKRNGLNALFVLGSLVVTLALAEATLRIAGISYPVFETYDALRGKTLRPGKRGWYNAEGESYMSINRFGFRDDEHSPQKPEGTFRIAVLGDSYVEAREVELKDTFWKRLEGELANCPGFPSVEVISFGISGYGQAQELLTLRHDVWRFSPDLVMTVFFAGNDLSDNIPSIVVRGRGAGAASVPRFTIENGELVLDPSYQAVSLTSIWRRFMLSAIHYSRLLELANQARRVFYASKSESSLSFIEPGLAKFAFSAPSSKEEHEAWTMTEALLNQMNREVKEKGADFLLVTATAAIQVAPDTATQNAILNELNLTSVDYPERRLSDFGRDRGIDVLTLADKFQSHARANSVHLHGFENTQLGKGHWNEQGHALAAKIIARKLCDKPANLVTDNKPMASGSSVVQ